MESNALEKSTNKSVTKRFFLHVMIQQIDSEKLWIGWLGFMTNKPL